MDENLYPNDGAAFFSPSVPEDQVKSADEQTKEAEDLSETFKESIQRLDDRIAYYKSIDAIDETLLTEPEAFMHAVAANKIVVSILQTEREVLASVYTAK